jgi:catechol 2,3-dioxygenase-like lactoylglutathione lyase family enzyme
MQPAAPVLRIARGSDDLDALLPFYVDGLGFEVLFRFSHHDGFDGLMIGHHDQPYHLEFTRQHGHSVGRAPSPENLLVFYLPDAGDYQAALGRMTRAGIAPVVSNNPYWDEGGATFEDPDGYRIVLTSRSWSR